MKLKQVLRNLGLARIVPGLIIFASAIGAAFAAHNITSPPARNVVDVFEVQDLRIFRGNIVEYRVECTASGALILDAILRAEGNSCQGVRFTAAGEPEVYSDTILNCTTSLGNAFLNATGGSTNRLNAFEDELETLGLFPAGT